MKYSIQADDEFLRVNVSGRENDEPPSDVCAVVLREARRLGRNRILIELDQKKALSPTSQLMLIRGLPEIGFTREDRIAIVHRTEAMQRANNLLGTMAENRGVNLRNFPSADAAKDWLRSQ